MAAEQKLMLGPKTPVSGGGGEGQDAAAVVDDGAKVPRLPRWTRQEILVLIQGKRVAENRVRRGRGIGIGSGQMEPKWTSVSLYCRRHGVNRGPVQCRKRWSNLSGDYKKIKEWELQLKDESESFWVMRNDLRRERRLPGFFDREVYDILDQGISNAPLPLLALTLAPATVEDENDGKEAEEVALDSRRSAAAEERLFSDFEQDDDGDGSGGRSSPKRDPETAPAHIPGTSNVEVNTEIHSTSQDGRRKRRRVNLDEETPDHDLQRRLIDALEKNSRLVAEQLEAQNNHRRLDRDQQRDQAGGFILVLNKLADALEKIADKL